MLYLVQFIAGFEHRQCRLPSLAHNLHMSAQTEHVDTLKPPTDNSIQLKKANVLSYGCLEHRGSTSNI